ncbi:MAG: PINc/VapC family ATPase [Candidatus Aenigmatarchaeota archaeon]
MKVQKIKREKIVPDTSILIGGVLSKLIENKELKNVEIIIPGFVVDELQAQASKGALTGFKGLEEIKKLNKFSEERDDIKVVKKGRRQTLEEIKLAKSGRIDALIMDVAKKENATLYTSDLVQKDVSEAMGIKTKYFKPYETKKKLKIEEFLIPNALSVHLKEGVPPIAKIGGPGKFEIVEVRKEPLTTEELENIIHEIMSAARYELGFVEMMEKEAIIIQLNDKRIAISRPPFSDGIEVTIVRPIVKLSIDDYKMPKELRDRIMKGEGIIIAGPPGSGKSTLAASIAEFYASLGKIVKTIEQPRDLQVNEKITQYTKLKGDLEKTLDFILLVRPDYTIFDEVRTTKDFIAFKDMRLAGIGMVGVIHANSPIDAIQRFLDRVDLGMLPHIVDTIIFVKFGKIDSVYKLSLVVRTPTGMTESDLIRPVVEFRNFLTNELEYEIYSYGEEKIIVPIKKEESAIERLARSRLESEIKKYIKSPEIEFFGNKAIIKVENKDVPKLIGKGGKTIKEIEKRVGISIEVLPKVPTLKIPIEFSFEESGNSLIFSFDKSFQNKRVSFYYEDKFIISVIVGKNGKVKINKNSAEGKKILEALINNKFKVFYDSQ